MTDPIADMLTRMRNASAVRKSEVVLPLSKMKLTIAKLLKQNHWIEDVEVVKAEGQKNGKGAFDQLRIVLRYENNKPVFTSLQRVSKPSRRVYAGKDNLPRVLNNMGMAIVSTSQGLMTNKEAGKKNIGGEIICEIY
jgi:small subunit ribosomal protein S8